MLMKLFWQCIITNNDVIAFTVNSHLYMKILSAFLYGYLYSDTLTGDQVTYQLYTVHYCILYSTIQCTQCQCTYIYVVLLYMYIVIIQCHCAYSH